MINKKGFTLIELIAVISLLLIMALIVIPAVVGNIDKTKQYAYDQMTKNIESVAKIYIANNKESIPNVYVINTKIQIPLQALINDGLIKTPIEDPKTGDIIDPEQKMITACVIGKNEYYISYNDIPSCEGRDFVPPTITLIGSNPVISVLHKVYTDAGATAYDLKDGDLTDKLVVNSNIDIDIPGTYSVIYTVTDAAGNNAKVTRNVRVINDIYNYNYLADSQTFIAPVNGMYKIESWGAQGGGTGGKGGYVSGHIYLRENAVITIRTGGTDGTNGGGSGVYRGGGATTIKYSGNIILTAAGGGGGAAGTDGGVGNGAGGSYKPGAGVTTPAPGVAGTAGTNGGGGGAGNKYKDCTGYEQVYNACLTGSNTCVAGYVNGTCATYNSCLHSDCGYATCQNAACGTTYSCSSGWTLSETQCYKGTSTRTLWRWYYRSCDCTCRYRYEAYGPPVQCFNSGTNYITDGTYYNTSTCDSACSQKNTGTVGGTCGGQSKHYSGSGTCSKVYTSWSTSSSKPSSSYNSSWYETKTEEYCPAGDLSGSNCWVNASSVYNTCTTSACGYATCRTSACGCQTYNQVYSPCVTGSNTCVGGYQNGVCNAFTTEKYESGIGGSNNINTTAVTNSTSTSGSNTGNGYARITFEGVE